MSVRNCKAAVGMKACVSLCLFPERLMGFDAGLGPPPLPLFLPVRFRPFFVCHVSPSTLPLCSPCCVMCYYSLSPPLFLECSGST